MQGLTWTSHLYPASLVDRSATDIVTYILEEQNTHSDKSYHNFPKFDFNLKQF